MNVLFFLRKSEVNKKGESPIIINYSCHKVTQKKIRSRLSVNQKHWDQKKQKVKKSENSYYINTKLDELKSLVISTMQKQDLMGASGDKIIREVKREVLEYWGVKTKTSQSIDFWAMYNSFYSFKKETTKASSMGRQNQLKAVLEGMRELYKDLEFDITNINHVFKSYFDEYCLIHKRYNNNTHVKHLGTFKTFMSWANIELDKKNIQIRNSYNDFKAMRCDPKKVQNLWIPEIRRLQKVDLNCDRLELCRDYFLAGMYYCMHYTDVYHLKNEHFKLEIMQMQKYREKEVNKKRLLQTIPLKDDEIFKPLSFFEKHKGKDDVFLLPRILNSNLNKGLKELQKSISFDRCPLTMDMARKTFVTNMWYNGVRIQHIMSAGGWQSPNRLIKHYLSDVNPNIDKAFENIDYDI